MRVPHAASALLRTALTRLPSCIEPTAADILPTATLLEELVEWLHLTVRQLTEPSSAQRDTQLSLLAAYARRCLVAAFLRWPMARPLREFGSEEMLRATLRLGLVGYPPCVCAADGVCDAVDIRFRHDHCAAGDAPRWVPGPCARRR